MTLQKALALATSVLLAACADTMQARFDTGKPVVRSPDLHAAVAPEMIVALLRKNAEPIAACFDEYHQRKGSAPSLYVMLDLEVRDHAVTVQRLRDPASDKELDHDLTMCVDDVVVSWDAAVGEGAITVPLSVTAREPPKLASRSEAFHPREGHDE